MSVSNSKPAIKVVHLMFSLEPGGLENGVVNLANHLDRSRFEVAIVCLERIGAFANRLQEHVSITDLAKKKGFRFRTVLELAGWLRSNRPDVIHTHNLGPLVYAVLSCSLVFFGFPILHGEHGTFRREDLTRKRLWMRRLLFRICGRVHTVSSSLTRYLNELGMPGKKIVTIANGVDAERFLPPEELPAVRNWAGIPLNALVIGMVGRMIASKRHELALDAFAKLAGECENAVLLLVGDGGDRREEVAGFIETHRYRERIYWVGHQDEPLLFYQAMDLLLMPSSVEGLSNALLEAMACGVPCLAHPACGASEVIEDGENGLLREMDTAGDIRSALREALSDRFDLIAMGDNARASILRDFSLRAMVEAYGRLYEEIAGAAPKT